MPIVHINGIGRYLAAVTGTETLQAFEAALAAFRFDEAEALLPEFGDQSEDLADRLERERRRAEEAAQRLYQDIVRRGTADDLAGVAALVGRPDAAALLGMLSEADRQRVEIHLAVARRWVENRKKRNARRLAEAQAALDRFDLELAKGLIANLDEQHLDETGIEQRDRILLDIEARKVELAPLREAERDFKTDVADSRRPWWRRRNR